MSKEPNISQPYLSEQREYASIEGNDATLVSILGTRKKYKVRWLKNCQLEYLSRLLIRKGATDEKDSEQDEPLNAILHDVKIGCKAAAIYLLNGYWKLKFWYGLLWRWFYYVKQYDNAQLQPILDEGKKKIPLAQFLLLTMSLTEARGTLMNMRAEEAERILHELASEQPVATEKPVSG